MKKFLYSIFVGMMILTLSACGTGDAGQSVESTPETLSETGTSSAVLEQSESSESLEVSSVDEVSSDIDIAEEPENTFRQISVQFGENTVVYELNDGTGPDSLYEQLPLTIEVED